MHVMGQGNFGVRLIGVRAHSTLVDMEIHLSRYPHTIFCVVSAGVMVN